MSCISVSNIKTVINIQEEPKPTAEDLFLAIFKEDTNRVQQLLDQNVSTDHRGETALHEATRFGYRSIVNLLLDRGISIHAVNQYRKTALHLAVECGDLTMVKLLLDRGASIDVTDERGETALHLAVRCNHLPILELLLDRGASIRAVNRYGETVLHLAVERCNPNMVKRLLDRGASIHAIDCLGATPFQFALKTFSKTEVLSLFIEAGAVIDESLLEPLQKKLYNQAFRKAADVALHRNPSPPQQLLPRELEDLILDYAFTPRQKKKRHLGD